MKLKEKINVIFKNRNFINRQVEIGDYKAIEMVKYYKMDKNFKEPIYSTLFEMAFDEWYSENKEIIKEKIIL